MQVGATDIAAGKFKTFKSKESLQHHLNPRELIGLGIKEYRPIFFKPYRLVYRINGSLVIIYLIADGRRVMQTVLARRLLQQVTISNQLQCSQARWVIKHTGVAR